MLNQNIRTLRKQRGMSQETLAQQLNVVRQTVSKWEKGASVPDAELLTRIADYFEVSVSELLGTHIEEDTNINEIAAQLAVLNEQFAGRNMSRQYVKAAVVCVCVAVMALAAGLFIGRTLWPARVQAPSAQADRATQEPALPDVLLASGVRFSTLNGSKVYYEFIPGAPTDGYTYSIAFKTHGGEVVSYDCEYESGMCCGEGPEFSVYTAFSSVCIIVSNGVEERAALIATDVEFDTDGCRWTPVS